MAGTVYAALSSLDQNSYCSQIETHEDLNGKHGMQLVMDALYTYTSTKSYIQCMCMFNMCTMDTLHIC